MGDNAERSFMMVKPDGVHRGVVGEIIKRFEQRGYRLVAMKFVWVRDRIGHGSGSDNDGCVYVFQWKIFVIIASHLTNFEKCGIKYVNI